jgi:hypoxanthine phosphoribosyltransferase
VYPKEYEGHFKSLMITKDEINEKVVQLANQIHKDYAGKRPVMLCVLKGATPFYQHLLDALQDLRQGFYTEFLRASSYEGATTTGTVAVGGGVEYANLTGKDVIIVEDIVDTGTTLSQLIPVLKEKSQPRSIETISLLSKRLDEPAKYVARYVGFSIPNHFIVGYGLDYNELYRDTKDIWIISQAGIDFDASSLLAV